MNSNSDNPKVGKAFQELVQRNIEDYFGQPFELEKAIPIGKPAKLHRFDLVSQDLSIVVEFAARWPLYGALPDEAFAAGRKQACCATGWRNRLHRRSIRQNGYALDDGAGNHPA